MNKVRHIERITQKELDSLTALEASWHYQYRDSAYVYVGGLTYRMNEGDLAIVFSQYGEIVDCRLARDKQTGRSRGFAFIAYEDQRSTVLAVDNLNAIELCGRTILVDHVKQYRIPREYLEDGKESEASSEGEGEEAEKRRWERKLYKPSGPDGKGWGDFRQLNEKDLGLLEEFNQKAAKDRLREEEYDVLRELKEKEEKLRLIEKEIEDNPQFILDEDKRWEVMFRRQAEREEKEAKEKLNRELKEQIETMKELIKIKQKGKKEKDSKKIKKEKKHKKEKKEKKEKRESE